MLSALISIQQQGLSLKADSRSAGAEIPRLLKPEGLLPCPQEPHSPTTSRSSPHFHTIFSKINFIIILTSTLSFSK
jgi:hypothetical protein